jgi:hypothetical protein
LHYSCYSHAASLLSSKTWQFLLTVINEFMKLVEEKKFYNHILKEHRNRMLKIKTGDFIESDKSHAIHPAN